MTLLDTGYDISSLVRLTNASNMGVPGSWIFQADSNIVTQGCGVSIGSPGVEPASSPTQGGGRLEISNLPRCLAPGADTATVTFRFPSGEQRTYAAQVTATDKVVLLAPPMDMASSALLSVTLTSNGTSEVFDVPQLFAYYVDPSQVSSTVVGSSVQLTWHASMRQPYTAVFLEAYGREGSLDSHRTLMVGWVTASGTGSASVSFNYRAAAALLLGTAPSASVNWIAVSVAHSADPLSSSGTSRSGLGLTNGVNVVVASSAPLLNYAILESVHRSQPIGWSRGGTGTSCQAWYDSEKQNTNWLSDIPGW